MSEIIEPTLTLKVIGNQWYWGYEYSDFAYKISNDSKNSLLFSFLDLFNHFYYNTAGTMGAYNWLSKTFSHLYANVAHWYMYNDDEVVMYHGLKNF